MKVSKHVSGVCKIGQMAACCRYLVCGAGGFECVKHTELRELLDSRVAAGTMNARGDNCDGQDMSVLNAQIEKETPQHGQPTM